MVAAAVPVRADTPAPPGTYRAGEFDLVRNIDPPGQTGFLTPVDALREVAGTGYEAPHQDDQEGMYADLVRRAPNITAEVVAADFKDASFGVPEGQVASVESPRPGVTIIRDRQFGVPHIYGNTDADVVFGTGWVLGEDRLFMTDVLRHYGRSTLASFLGPDRSFIEMDCQQKQLTGYTEEELDAQVARLPQPFPDLAQAYVAGINAYIDATLTDPSKLPAEYLAFGLRPQHFDVGDVIAIAGLVGGIFGKGGGVETRNAHFLRALYAQLGGPGNASQPDPTTANAVFGDFMETNDPAAPTTIDQPFPYETGPYDVAAPGVALTKDPPPDPLAAGGTCSVSGVPSLSLPATPTIPTALAAERRAAVRSIVAGLLALPRAMSNALLVDRAHSSSGRPIAVMGPQVGYFAPEILMEEDLHGPSYDVRGVSFPGTNFIVELGHGPDYAWSATSAGTDNVDQFAERLCNPNSPDPLANVDPNSTFYLYQGSCVPMYERTDQEIALPSPGSTNCQSGCLPVVVSFRVERTIHGPVLGRTTALVDGREVPVAIASQRTTFMHEADSVVGFAAYDNPKSLRDAQDFLVAASQINYTFNWFYVDDRDIAYYQSGWLPIRSAGVHPDLPTWGTGQYDWKGGWNALTGKVGTLFDVDAHPHAIDPPRGFITSWNNKGAPSFRAADDQWSWGPVHRSQSLDDEIRAYLARGHGRMSLVDLVNAMEDAATIDLIGTKVLPDALRLVGDDPRVASQVALLSAWVASGAHRRDTTGSGVYDQVQAVILMDTWWPKLLHALFDPVLGNAFAAVPEIFDDHPGPVGSAYIEGWYGYAQKALEMALGIPVPQPDAVRYCASGCREAVVRSLQEAAADAAHVDPKAFTRADDIRYTAIGLGSVPPMAWQNRPTFQQVVNVPGHRGRAVPGETSSSTVGEVAALTSLPTTGASVAAGTWTAVGVAGLLLAAGGRRRRRRRGTSSVGG